MSNNLVIVESPAKAKTIKKYLGQDFEVLASYGHVRDLVPKEGAVNPDRNFEMRYELIERNERHVNAIERALKKARALYLATDPDREGEAISWHLYEILKARGALKDKQVHRAKFFEITKNEVNKAIAAPEKLSTELVNAQQARRALDFLVGFNLSPLLWKKIMPGLSAGRVQSVALRLVCEREAEIAAFVRQEYWTVEVDAAKDGQAFRARVVEVDGDKLEADVGKGRFSLTDEAAAREVQRRLNAACGGRLRVANVESKPRSRNPQGPFRTSTLQQAAANRLGFSARRTMQLAQKLYEGVDFGEGPVGLITYMRTDSTSLSVEAIGQIRETIGSLYGKEALPDVPRSYANKQKNAQEAHEAIRPTSAANTPDKLRGHIDEDMWRLYALIWKRTIASQMASALFEQVTVTMHPGAAAGAPVGVVRASGSTLVKPGYLVVYEVDRNDDEEAEEGGRLPALATGEIAELVELRPEQHFTEPPPRYTEAGLVKALEERGIGRPSTYAAIIETLRARRYVEDERRNFVPTDTGKIVSQFLVRFFPQYVDYDFTARLEDDLDDISRGEKEWIPVLRQFWRPFIDRVKDIEANVTREQVAQARQLGVDPASGRPVSVRVGQYGPFVQLGTKDDVAKPKFAGLRPGQKMGTITLAEALKLFTLPRTLGELPTGEQVVVGIGRFGPYIKYGVKYVSIKTDDPYSVDLARALALIEEKRHADAARLIRDFGVGDLQVLNGRFGPYVTDGKRNARIPKDRDPSGLTLEEARALLVDAPLRGASRFGRKKGAAAKARAPATAADTAPAPAPAPPAARHPAPRKLTAQPATAARPAAAKAALVIKARKPSTRGQPKSPGQTARKAPVRKPVRRTGAKKAGR
ncbi:MAG TPA: type I DNA topoisomerase [Steroidobacteraceae bacterium]|nr:type I DNA topoisomerase [Steroidobacteraceae bacterium]